MDVAEFYSDTFRLRAIFMPNVDLLEDSGESSGEKADVWVWWFGPLDRDEWLAHGLSDVATEDVACRMVETIDVFLMDALIAYFGQPWEILAAMPLAHANMQRDLVSALPEERLDDLRVTPTEDIKRQREAEVQNIRGMGMN